MNTFEAIKNRKSVRTYTDQPVEAEKIKAIVEAGYMAAGSPMSGKRYFNVISNREILNQLADTTKAVMQKSGVDMLVKLSSNPNYNPLYNAPVAVVISTDKGKDPNSVSILTSNAACAGENMLLAAADLGLSSCYLVSPTLAFFDLTLREIVKIPYEAVPAAVIVFGYSNDVAPHSTRPQPLDNIVYID